MLTPFPEQHKTGDKVIHNVSFLLRHVTKNIQITCSWLVRFWCESVVKKINVGVNVVHFSKIDQSTNSNLKFINFVVSVTRICQLPNLPVTVQDIPLDGA